MVELLGTFAFAVSVGQSPQVVEKKDDDSDGPSRENTARSRIEGQEELGDGLTAVELEREEKRMFAIRLTFALGLFLTFWLVSFRNFHKEKSYCNSRSVLRYLQ
jgi:hypothetical protein